MKKCPYCAEEIKDQAVKCRFCGEFFDKNRSVDPKRGPGCFTGCLVFILIILVLNLIFFKFIFPKVYSFVTEKIKEVTAQTGTYGEFKDSHRELIEKLKECFTPGKKIELKTP